MLTLVAGLGIVVSLTGLVIASFTANRELGERAKGGIAVSVGALALLHCDRSCYRCLRSFKNRFEPLTTNDILVVAPYNAHVALLTLRLPPGARVGTVDKFQGQEAPVVIYSMATSTPAEAPRGLDFLYSLHRLNVAISRAQGMAILICNPALLDVKAHTPEQMRLANALCRLVELAPAIHP